MNRKALVFLPVFSFVIFLVLTAMFVWFNLNEEKVKEDIGFGEIQSDLFNTFFEAEKDTYYYEKQIEYNILKTTSTFNKQGGLKPECSNVLKFNTDCEFDSDYYLELFGLNAQIEGNFIIFNLEKEYSKTGEDYDYTYKKDISIKKEININLEELENLKSKIKTCLQDNDKSKDCLGYFEINGNIISYKIEIEPNLYDNSPLEFKLDLDDTGVITSIIN